MLNSMRVSTRLTATLGLLTALLLAIVGIGLWQMGSMRVATEEITDSWLPSVQQVGQIKSLVNEMRIAEFKHMVNIDDAHMERIEKEMVTLQAALEEARKAYQPLISSDEERKLYQTFAAGWLEFMKVHERVLEFSRQNENDQARVLLEGDSLRIYHGVVATLSELVKLNADGADAASDRAEASHQEARVAMLMGFAVSLLASIVAGAWLVRSLTRQLGGEPAEASGVASAIAEGDLSRSIAVRPGDQTSLIARLAAMQASLARVVSEVRSNSESVATASAQIAQGNHDLSGRTEEQASALQQTAATMEQLGTTVRSNAQNARQANELAQSASSVAAQGGEVVGRVVTTMQGINDSSRKIGDIISVIDGIAFQTNILALNAAVEAARAGEQGRGFAVVASEVRSLAQRSAEAAKEIKTLIGRSVEQVEQGTALVDEAGKTMGEIVTSIQRVTDIVAEITQASAEQSSGVQQVGEAVGQMDRTTQQNAALVEQSAAAAESLKTQARQLVQAVAVFKLAAQGAATGRTDATAPASAPRAAPAQAPRLASRPPARPKAAAAPRKAGAPAARRPAASTPPVSAPKPVGASTVSSSASSPSDADHWETF